MLGSMVKSVWAAVCKCSMGSGSKGRSNRRAGPGCVLSQNGVVAVTGLRCVRWVRVRKGAQKGVV